MPSARVYASSAADGGEFYTWTSPSNANGAPDGSTATVNLADTINLSLLNFTITRAGLAIPGGKTLTGVGYGIRWGATSLAAGSMSGDLGHSAGDFFTSQGCPSPIGDTTGGGVGSFFGRTVNAWTTTNMATGTLYGYLTDGISNDLEVDAIWLDYYYTSGNRKRKMVRRSPHRS